MAEETKSRLRVDEDLLKKLKAVAALDSPPRDPAEYLLENISTNALSSALSATRGDAAKTASLNLRLVDARRRNRAAADNLLLCSTSAVDELTDALAAAKKVGLNFPVDEKADVLEENRRDILAKEQMLILGGKEEAAGMEGAAAAVAEMPPEAARRLCSLESFRQILSCRRIPKLMFEIESRDEVAKRRLIFASRLNDAKMMKEATDDFKRVGLTNTDGPLEEVEQRLIEAAWDLKTEKKDAAAAGVDNDATDVFETSRNRLKTFLRPQESERVHYGEEEKVDGTMSLIREAIESEDWNALSEGVEKMKWKEDERGSPRRATEMWATAMGDSGPATIASKAELLLLTALLVEGRDAPFRSGTLAASTSSLKALDEELRDKDAESLRIALEEMKRKVLNELEERMKNPLLFYSAKEEDQLSDEEDGLDGLDGPEGRMIMDVESTYEPFSLSFSELPSRSETPEFLLSTDGGTLRGQLKRYILEAIQEEDLRKLHQLVDIADARGIDKFELPVVTDANAAIERLVNRSGRFAVEGQRLWKDNLRRAAKLEVRARRHDGKERARILFEAALLSGDAAKISKAIARVLAHDVKDCDVKLAKEYLRLLLCKAEIERAAAHYDIDSLRRELSLARRRKFAAFSPPFLPNEYFWGFFVANENLLGQWLTLRNVHRDLAVISTKELAEVISYKSPPVATELVLRAFLLLLASAPSKKLHTWEGIRQSMKTRTSLTARMELARIRPEHIATTQSSAALRCLGSLDQKSVLRSSRPLLVFYRFTKSLAHQAAEAQLAEAQRRAENEEALRFSREEKLSPANAEEVLRSDEEEDNKEKEEEPAGNDQKVVRDGIDKTSAD